MKCGKGTPVSRHLNENNIKFRFLRKTEFKRLKRDNAGILLLRHEAVVVLFLKYVPKTTLRKPLEMNECYGRRV